MWDSKSMKARPSKKRKPFEIVRSGSISAPIHRCTNIILRCDESGQILYKKPDANGKSKALVKYKNDIYTVAY